MRIFKKHRILHIETLFFIIPTFLVRRAKPEKSLQNGTETRVVSGTVFTFEKYLKTLTKTPLKRTKIHLKTR